MAGILDSLNSLNNSSLRLGGLNSGMDTEKMLTQMMRFEQAKLDRQFQNIEKTRWKMETYGTSVNSLKTFRNEFMSALSDKNMMSSSAIKNYKVTTEDKSGAATVTASAQASASDVTINQITQLAQAAGFSTKFSGAKVNSTLKNLGMGDSVSFSINGKTFTFSGDTTLSKVMSDVSADPKANVSMKFTELTGEISIMSKETGVNSSVKIVNGIGNMFGENSAIGISGAKDQVAAGANVYQDGKNAKLTINNIAVERESNNFTIDGIGYALKSTTEVGANIRYTIGLDIDKTVSKVKEFVDNYNKIFDSFSQMVSEKRPKTSYPPLTETQRGALSEKEIEEWEKQAKQGLMRSDPEMTKLITEMRFAFYQVVPGQKKSAADIGLTAMRYDPTNKTGTTGRIELDENKLREALKNNPDEVDAIFNTVSSSSDPATKRTESGLMQKLYETMNNYVNTISNTTMVIQQNGMDRANSRLAEMKTRFAAKETAMWKKFTAMETALSKLNNQSSWLSQQLSGMG